MSGEHKAYGFYSVRDDDIQIVKHQKVDNNKNDVQDQIEALKFQLESYSQRVKDLPGPELTLKELKEEKKLVDAKLKFQRLEEVEKSTAMKKVKVNSFVDSLNNRSGYEDELKTWMYSLDNEKHDYAYTVITSEGVSKNYETQFELAKRVFGKINKLKKAFGIKDADIDDIGDDTMEIKQDGETYSLEGLNLDKKVKAYAKEHKCSYDVAFYKVIEE